MVERTEEQENLSPQDVREWFHQEVADLSKALELRLKESSELVTAYTSGKISPEEAGKRFLRYNRRWGEALPGTHAGKGVSDDQILKAIDEVRDPEFVARLLGQDRQKRER